MNTHQLNQAFQQQNAAELADLAKLAILEAPDTALGYYYLAEALWIQKQVVNAEIALTKAIELDPEKLDYLLRLATFKMEQNAIEDAHLIYRKAMEIAPDNLELSIALAKYYLHEAADYEEALALVNNALVQYPDHAELLVLYAQCQLLLEEIDEALEASEKSLVIDPSEEAYIVQINALSSLGDQESLLEVYPKLVDHTKAYNSGYRVLYANFLLGEQQFAAAESELQFLLSNENSNDLPLMGLLGLAFLGQQKFALALELFNSMEELDPEDEEVYLQRANAHLGLNNSEAALGDLQKAIDLLEGDAQLPVLLKIAEIHLDQQAYPKAQAIYQQLSNSELYAKEGYFGLGKALHLQGELNAAFNALRQAQKLRFAAAKAYLYTHFQQQLAQIQQKILTKLAPEIEKNQQSVFLKAHFGKWTQFDPYKNKLSETLPNEVLKKLSQELKETGFVMTEQGFILLNPIEKRALRATYRILEEDEESALLEVFPLDNSNSFQTLITVEGTTLSFEPQLKKAKAVNLRIYSSDKIKNSTAKVIKNYLTQEDCIFLGDKAGPFIQQVFG